VRTDSENPRVVVIGASAGGVEAMIGLLQSLPDVFDEAIFVVIHLSESHPSALVDVLQRKTAHPVRFGEQGSLITHGAITVAPAGTHMELTPTRVRLIAGPRENGYRPAIDPLFRSAAASFGPVTGVLLSGALDDGVAGLAAIKRAGGRVLVQDPEEAPHPWMPLNAIAGVAVDGILPVKELAQAMLTTDEGAEDGEREVVMALDRGMPEDRARDDEGPIERLEDVAASTGLTCPACGGAIWEMEADGVPVLRCHVGHVYGLESFSHEQSLALESALWSGVRALDEKEALLRRLGDQARTGGRDRSAGRFEAAADDTRDRASMLRDMVESIVAASPSQRDAPAGTPA
jgi:two-component system, chemotaxis family, protein-glutamate methylesterase/glutaminase